MSSTLHYVRDFAVIMIAAFMVFAYVNAPTSTCSTSNSLFKTVQHTPTCCS